MMALVLLGLFGVPAVLLWKGQSFRSFTPRGLRAYRGAVIGYGASLLIVTMLLVFPPYLWPPSGAWTAGVLSGGLLIGPVLGATLGGLLGGHGG